MSFSYNGTIFDKRGCYVILPASPFWRFDSNDNSAEVDEDVEVLEGPEVEIMDSCEADGDEPADMELDVSKSCTDESEKNDDSHQTKGASAQRKKARTDPDNKYYEVEAILDGPKKRREHLFKLCYKVRWKGYGSDADTWQPIADLSNVQDMIDDFKKEKAVRKEKKKFVKNSPRWRSQQRTPPLSVENRCEGSGKKYDPVYGTVKDKFWKDLELGHHQNHSQLFCGDMYSKVKGSRRSGHTEALANTHRKHYLLSKSARASSQASLSALKSSSRLLRGDYLRKPRSASPASQSSLRSESPKHSPTSRLRKRSSDASNAIDYMCAKRSKKSREAKNGYTSPDGKQSGISTVTSETVGIVMSSSPVSPPAVPDASTESPLPTPNTCSSNISSSPPVFTVSSRSSPAAAYSSDSDDGAEDASPRSEQGGRMTVSSETMLTVTTETRRLDVDTQRNDQRALNADSRLTETDRPEDTYKHNTDGKYRAQYSSLHAGASGCGSEDFDGPWFDDSGATSGGSVPGRCQINKTPCVRWSALDARSEASGAVERSHDEECLWNGACNRSDCKSNRRRNMKNGLGKVGGTRPPGADNEDDENVGDENVVLENGDNAGDSILTRSGSNTGLSREGEDWEEENTNSASGGKRSSPRSTDGTSVGTSRSSLPSGQSSSLSRDGGSSSPSNASGSRSKRPSSHSSSSHKLSSKVSGSQPRTSAQNMRLLFSSAYADSSDSSFDDGGEPLCREAVSDSFGRMDALAHRLHMDTFTGSTTSKAAVLGSSACQVSSGGSTSRGSVEGRKNSMEVERPGLFSGNNGALFFTKQDSGDYSSTTPEDKLPSSSSVIDLNSLGKENFGRSSSRASGLTVSSSSSRHQTPVGVDVPNTNSGTTASSQVHSLSSQPRTLTEHPEEHAARKRNNIFQPLEKIPSPNARESDLDQRIMTLTCDDLEDFVEQGEERSKQKDLGFVSNADLLQAVNLNKAEVVKRAIKQIRSNERKLDFEQPDITGLTLLMRAVQKSTAAIVEMLLEHGVNVNAQQINGTTALMIAAEQNGTCLVALLLKYGANSSLYTVHSGLAETALMKAIKKQNRDVVNLMLRVGVNIAAPTCTSLSALDFAIERRNPHVEGVVRFHCQRLDQAFRSRVLATLDGTANLLEPLFAMQCFPLRESSLFVVNFNSHIQPVAPGEGFLLFVAHTKITEKGVKCRFHGGCPISSVTLNGIVQSPLTKEVNFVTSCHPIIQGCNTLVIHKLADYTSKAKLVVQAFRAKLLPC